MTEAWLKRPKRVETTDRKGNKVLLRGSVKFPERAKGSGIKLKDSQK